MGRLDYSHASSIIKQLIGGNMKFKFYECRERTQQTFDKDKIELTKAGKTYNLYDKIQEAREDTEIYPTLEKYGCIDRMMLDVQGTYNDFTNFKGLRELKDQQAEANRMFYNLPTDTRQVFNNDINQFIKGGEKYLKKLIDEDIKKATEAEKITTSEEKING